MQYGNETKVLAVALVQEGAVSIQRTHDILTAISGLSVSTGSIAAWNTILASSLKGVNDRILEALLKERVVNCDGTGMPIDGAVYWLHNASTALFTYQFVSKIRGYDGMIEGNFLNRYTGIICTDCWSP